MGATGAQSRGGATDAPERTNLGDRQIGSLVCLRAVDRAGSGLARGRSGDDVRYGKGRSPGVDPVGVISAAEAVVPPAPRLRTLAGKKVWVVVVDNGSTLMPAVAALLPEYAPGVLVKTILTSETGNPFFMLRAEDRPDAVIAGTGVCESTTVDTVSYAKQAEKLEIPAVVSFLDRVLYAHRQAMDKLQFFGVRAFGTELPDSDRPADPERLARTLVPRFIEGLTRPLGADRSRICFTGPEAEARAYFESLGWTGGLTVVLPTEERVAAVLRGRAIGPTR